MHHAELGTIWGVVMGDQDDKNEIIAHEWATLRTLWRSCESRASQYACDEMKKILGGDDWSSEKEDWDRLNRAEQFLGIYLDLASLKIEYDNLLNMAQTRSLSALPTFEEYRKRLFQNSPTADDGKADTAQVLEVEQRAAYLALLYTLQSGFVETRFERKLRSRTAIRLSKIGGALVVAVVCLHVAHEFISTSKFVSAIPLLTVIVFGALGAFFSRITAFHLNFSELRFEDIANNYRRHIFLVRILCGAIGAIVLYYLLQGRLLEGPMVPDWSVIGADLSSSRGRTPMTEWSKLLVWSFVAGFSERLVPSTLDRVR
jgi:hypothetical protein